MVQIVCDTKKEKVMISRMLRLANVILILMGCIFKHEVEHCNTETIKYLVKHKK